MMLGKPRTLKAAILGKSDEFNRIGKNIAKRCTARAVPHEAEQAEFGHPRNLNWAGVDYPPPRIKERLVKREQT